jgi:hypothetical protein
VQFFIGKEKINERQINKEIKNRQICEEKEVYENDKDNMKM